MLGDSETSLVPQMPRESAISFHPTGELEETPGENTTVGGEMWAVNQYSQAGFQACCESWTAVCLAFCSFVAACYVVLCPCALLYAVSGWKMSLSVLAEYLSKWSV